MYYNLVILAVRLFTGVTRNDLFPKMRNKPLIFWNCDGCETCKYLSCHKDLADFQKGATCCVCILQHFWY